MHLRHPTTAAIAAMVTISCTVQDAATRDSTVRRQGASASAESIAEASGWRAGSWTAPSLDSLADDPIGRSIRRGHALFAHTSDSLPRFVGAKLSCRSCHLDDGRRPDAIPLFGIHGIYPRYLARADAVVPMEDRVNYCITRSLAGWRLPNESTEMQDLIAYMAFLSRGVPVGVTPLPIRMVALSTTEGDSARGAAVYRESCARCHGMDGEGTVVAPPTWGEKSFSIGASMAQPARAAAFIRRNMPFDLPGTLTDQQSYDVAVYITSMPRPDLPGKENDWPRGDAPADVPYATKGREPKRTPTLIPRQNPERALVPIPRTANGTGG